ncbi:aldehyde dehydrogenase (NADP(+)) [Paractinoplanes atraurantiacus]|uniref:NADP-dependent aldehyde dehydrogenase n=1 Tax=Paractinoplanes atraurantiacus TaxID=1036182 RepID=A0A285IL58_9ACTN|nr:aldehyde dehydrogenase (NADP(+)) [Actinoplanes atraurantiacus]SNY47836.1 NADP-dependent aldehyde dehydrogenase [Actinoplanes atraurantiacus]
MTDVIGAAAAADFGAFPPHERARALVAVADALDAAADELIPVAQAETGLAEGRLRGELKRTTVQLRLFASVAAAGEFLDVRIDDADPDFVLGPRPDLRRYRVPLGPVLNFAASNFPFAFSVLGGDTASALAAGCPVVVKAHPGHPKLSDRTAEIARAAIASTGLPADALTVIHGQEEGVAALRDPRITAAAFTGSVAGGRALARIAAEREHPIPFYGELGSINPVVVTPAALAERADQIAAGFATSVTSSAGQLCTKPGLLFVPTAEPASAHAAGSSVGAGGFAGLAAGAFEAAGPHRLLHPGIAEGYARRRDEVLGTSGVTVVVAGEVADLDASPTLVETDLATLIEHRDTLLDEAFGPLSVVVRYEPGEALAAELAGLVEGSLAAGVHTGEGEDSPWLRDLVALLSDRSGRLLFNGWPTGVAVTPAQQHGGPWPATTNPTTTSVGTAAIDRFLRPVTYQDCPPELLPEPLRDDNPWGVPQHRSRAGESAHWGEI